MQAYHNKPELKAMLLEEVKRHREADLLYQRAYAKEVDGKMKFYAVGCAIHSLNLRLGKHYDTNDHAALASELDIPLALPYLQDRIFEGLPRDKAMFWPERLLEAIPVGADLSLVVPRLMVWLMDDLKQYAQDFPEVLTCLETVESLYTRVLDGGIVEEKEWEAAREAIWAARATEAAEAAEAAGWAVDTAGWVTRAAAWATARATRVARVTRRAGWATRVAEAAGWAKRATRAADLVIDAAGWAVDAACASNAAGYKKTADQLITILESTNTKNPPKV